MTASLRVNELNSGAFTIENFLSAEECQRYIALGDSIGYVPSEVGFPSGSRRAEDIRNNDRVVFDDPALAQMLFDRARALLPSDIDGWQLHGFNERLRYYRYAPGQFFKWHKDGVVALAPGVESRLTFMIYLNSGFQGGATEFRTQFVEPKTGMALVFPHRTTHQGMEIQGGIKYVLRTDVVYRKQAEAA
jgi:prolyl 4-hydroxylase